MDKINQLRQYYTAERHSFDFYTSMFFAGPANKHARRQLIQDLTGQILPLSKCSLGKVTDTLKAHFDQPKLF